MDRSFNASSIDRHEYHVRRTLLSSRGVGAPRSHVAGMAAWRGQLAGKVGSGLLGVCRMVRRLAPGEPVRIIVQDAAPRNSGPRCAFPCSGRSGPGGFFPLSHRLRLGPRHGAHVRPPRKPPGPSGGRRFPLQWVGEISGLSTGRPCGLARGRNTRYSDDLPRCGGWDLGPVRESRKLWEAVRAGRRRHRCQWPRHAPFDSSSACWTTPSKPATELTREQIDQVLCETLGASNIFYLPGGIAGDDTGGHVDDLCRFVNPRTVVILTEEIPTT